MPRFYFHVEDGTSRPDEEGTELPDLDAAYNEAVVLSGSILQEIGAEAIKSSEPWRVRVTQQPDVKSRAVLVLSFSASKEG